MGTTNPEHSTPIKFEARVIQQAREQFCIDFDGNAREIGWDIEVNWVNQNQTMVITIRDGNFLAYQL